MHAVATAGTERQQGDDVTHDIKIAGTAERLLVMRDGALREHQRSEPAEDVVEVFDRLLDTS